MEQDETKESFTVLSKKQEWQHEEKLKLLKMLPNCLSVHNDLFQPQILVVRGGYTKKEIELLLGTGHFEHQIVKGVDNPVLPFKISI
ncbi:hypothetical protein ACFL2U_00395 [Patescibacteria group bacterium]